jgi:hypothetical protein
MVEGSCPPRAPHVPDERYGICLTQVFDPARHTAERADAICNGWDGYQPHRLPGSLPV